jgi:hypothetical protein
LVLVLIDAGVENLFYFVLHFAINLHRGWLGLGLTRDRRFFSKAQP